MAKTIDKKEIQARIDALRKKIATQGLNQVLDKKTTTADSKQEVITLGKEGVFYILETRTLAIAILVCLAIIFSAYYINLKTDYLNLAASYFFRLFS
jgi:hypothetical protein